MTSGFKNAYLILCQRFPPRPIRGRRQFRQTQAVIDRLIDKAGGLSRPEREYLATLGALVYEYEERTVEIPAIHGADLVRVLIEERGLRQKDLTPIFRSESIASAVLNGRRQLTRRHIEELARFFHTSPAVFFPDSEAARKVA